ncbi:MAG: redoxin domain-containing protein [Bacteroidales bacterium]|nr:redoxin domain-containing protein [Bacteroidales bacterium]
MKKLLLLCTLALAVALVGCKTQHLTAKDVILSSYQKCQSIQCGHYEAGYLMKYMSDNDTAYYHYTCDFKKSLSDTIFGKTFNFLEESKTVGANYKCGYIYTGNEYVLFSDSLGTVMSCDKWARDIVDRRHQIEFYTPLTNRSSYPLRGAIQLLDTSYTYSLSETKLDGKKCHLVSILGPQVEDKNFGMKIIRYETKVWIDKKDYLPLKYSTAFDIVQQKDTMREYKEFKLLSFSPQVDETKLTLDAVPKTVTLKDYVPYTPKEPEMLPEGTPAPLWSLPNLAGDTVSLADLKGKVVLVDFFYKSCAPCCAALPCLQSLHEKYKDKGFVMIGIDPIDDPVKAKMADFLAKRDVTYTVLFSDRELPKEYHVSGYPTLYFIDRNGNIVHTQIGFSTTLEEELEKKLVEMLGK